MALGKGSRAAAEFATIEDSALGSIFTEHSFSPRRASNGPEDTGKPVPPVKILEAPTRIDRNVPLPLRLLDMRSMPATRFPAIITGLNPRLVIPPRERSAAPCPPIPRKFPSK